MDRASIFHQSLSNQPPKGDWVPLFNCPIIHSLSSCISGNICTYSCDHLYFIYPLPCERNINFSLLSNPINRELLFISPKLVHYISGRRWKQRSVGEVELKQDQTVHQIELNILLANCDLHELHSYTAEKSYISNCVFSPSGCYFDGNSFFGVIISREAISVMACNPSDNGLHFRSLSSDHLCFISNNHPVDIHYSQRAEILWTDSYGKMLEKLNCLSIVAADWSNIFNSKRESPYLLLAAGTRDGKLFIWQVTRIDTTFHSIKIKHQYNYSYDNLTWINLLSWSGNYNARYSYLALCFTDGTISILVYCILSQNIFSYNIYNEKDGSIVSRLIWRKSSANVPSFYFIKANTLFGIYFSLDDFHNYLGSEIISINISCPFPQISFNFLFDRFIVVGFKDCTFSLFEIHQSCFIHLSLESSAFSEYVRNYLSRQAFSICQMLDFLFSPNFYYIILYCSGKHLSNGTASKSHLSRQNRLVFLSLMDLSFIINNVPPLKSRFLEWDFIKLHISHECQESTAIPSSRLFNLDKTMYSKLNYISDVIYGRASLSMPILSLLRKFNYEVQSLIFSMAPLTSDFENFLHFEEKLMLKYADTLCDICASELEYNDSKMQFSCLNQHIFDCCLFTLEIIHLNDEYLRCSMCKRKVLLNAMRKLLTLFDSFSRIACPLCDGFFFS